MKLYTRGGDQGETSLWGGKRVSKAHVRLEAIGTIDELNAYVGLVISCLEDQSDDVREVLVWCQNKLFSLGAEMALASGFRQLGDRDITFLEEQIDRFDDETTPLRNFILPGGHAVAAKLHIARTIARRGERAMVILNESDEAGVRPLLLSFVNRLSDLFFALARVMNSRFSVSEDNWTE